MRRRSGDHLRHEKDQSRTRTHPQHNQASIIRVTAQGRAHINPFGLA
jgi:hypothetical protein